MGLSLRLPLGKGNNRRPFRTIPSPGTAMQALDWSGTKESRAKRVASCEHETRGGVKTTGRGKEKQKNLVGEVQLVGTYRQPRVFAYEANLAIGIGQCGLGADEADFSGRCRKVESLHLEDQKSEV